MDTGARYLRFAEVEADDRSPLYAALARGVAGDRATIDFLSTLPPEKRQPNLLFAALRHLFGTTAGWADFRRTLLANRDAVRALMLTRATQTNEPARCAVLLPVLAGLPQPLALIEVGASAGLCLLPDYYSYDYGREQLQPVAPVGDPPLFGCTVDAATPLPRKLPEIVWRAGLDLNPLDAADPDQAAWLETLVWPEHADRLLTLRAALRVARTVRPMVQRGNLLGDALDRLCDAAPKAASLVVFHTAVLAYVAGRAVRDDFARRVMSLCPYWISNEVPGVFSGQVAGGATGRFLLSLNGRPMAWTDPHGASMEWIPRA